MSFDFKKFANTIHEQFKESFTKEEVDDLLNINDGYNKDTPVSTGKRLIIHKVRLIGKKGTSENPDYSEKEIDFTLPLKSGVNILIADNLKGKSSVFKVIKYALTGKNSLKTNIKKWLHYAFVNFYINEKEYTAYLDLSKGNLKACLLNGFHESIVDLESETISKQIVFQASGESSYQEKMNDFIFKQFTYYSLKWTQKSSAKDNNQLLESSASWATYFKSILLESKDSASLMYGAQGKKVFQMLLGIELTYPINRLTIKKDMMSFEKGKQQSLTETQRKQAGQNLLKFQARLKEIENEIAQLQSKRVEKINLSPIYQEYNKTLERIKSENAKFQAITNDKQTQNKELNSIKRKQIANAEELHRLNKELNKSIKQLTDLREYIEIGVLFSNLDIKHCPSCNHDVSETHKKNSLQEHKCSLCGDDIENDNPDMDTAVYEEKISNLEVTIKNIEKELKVLTEREKDLQVAYNSTYAQLVTLEQSEGKHDTSELTSKLQELEETINSSKNEVQPEEGQKEKLIAEEAVLLFQIKQFSQIKPKGVSEFDTKIQLLNAAIEKLSEERLSIGRRVIDRLSNLMTTEIQALGLNSITEIKIDDNFEIQYKQDDDFITFDNIAEGEQLRAKIAFYLSLIQLDIEFNFGRHTRLLIIDSPGKEEADTKYLEGLSLVLKSIENRYSDNLQILIGTAERQLSGVLKNQTEIPVSEYVF